MSIRPRILIADDDSLVRDLVRARLNGAGYDTHTAASGREAIDRTVIVRPHALLLDINLPLIDGFEVLTALREQLPDLDVPILMVTARRSGDDVRRAMSLGAADYLTKDVITTQLLPRLARVLRIASQPKPEACAA